MAIFNPVAGPGTDPDYPVPSAGFAQHQCVAPQSMMQQSWYYNGQTVMPTTGSWGMTAPQELQNSRRFDATPGMPVGQMAVPGQTPGFNQLAENSRRNMAAMPQPQQNVSPWAQPAPAQPAMYPSFQPEPYDRYSALANYRSTFDKSQGAWLPSNTPSIQPVPVVNWNAAQQGQTYPAFAQPATTVPAMIVYPQQTAQPVQVSWEQIALQNFPK